MSKHLQGFSGGSVVKNLPANARDSGLIPGPERSTGEGNGNPLPYSCLENPHGERSLVGYSPQGRKESDTTEHSTAAAVHNNGSINKEKEKTAE